MSKPRTIWVPRIRMQRLSTNDALAAFVVTLDHGLHRVGPCVEGLFSLLEFHTGQKRSVMAICEHSPFDLPSQPCQLA